MEKITCIKTITIEGECENLTFEFDSKQEARDFMSTEWFETMDKRIADVADTHTSRTTANIRFSNGDYVIWTIVDSNVTTAFDACNVLNELIRCDESLRNGGTSAVLTLWLTIDGNELLVSLTPNLYNEYYHFIGSYWFQELSKYIGEIEMNQNTGEFTYVMDNLPLAEFLDIVNAKNARLLDYEISIIQ